MNTHYVEYNTNRTALIKETILLIRLYVKHKSWKKVSKDVYEDNVLMKNSKAMKEKIYSIVRKRYISPDSDFEITPFISIINSNLAEKIKMQCIYYEFARNDPIVFDLVNEVFYSRYKRGFNSISKENIEEFLKAKEKEHSELKKWAITTRARFIRHFLSTLKEFEILKGSNIKEFNKPYLTIEAFIYILYSEINQENKRRDVLSWNIWHIFFLEADDIKIMLRDATKQGHIIFEEKGSVANITYLHKNLEAAVNAIARK